jgi:hypothetical protein
MVVGEFKDEQVFENAGLAHAAGVCGQRMEFIT